MALSVFCEAQHFCIGAYLVGLRKGAQHQPTVGGVGSLWGAVLAGLMVGMVVALTGSFASEWSLMSMYLLFIVVVTFRARGLFGKKSVLDT